MAKGKGGKPSVSAGPKLHKKHGPKKKMWHCWDSTTRLHFGQAGLLTKYYNKESFEQWIKIFVFAIENDRNLHFG